MYTKIRSPNNNLHLMVTFHGMLHENSFGSESEEILPDPDMIDNGFISAGDYSSVDEDEHCIDTVRPEALKAQTYRLPIKVNGKLIQQFEDDSTFEIDGHQEKPLLINDTEPNETEIPTEQSFVEFLHLKHKSLFEYKTLVAKRSMLIIQDPESEIGSLCSLVADLRKCGLEEKAKKLILIAALTEVFLHVTPGYRIRQLSEKEKSVKVRKDTLKIRQFEESFLKQYKSFIDCLSIVIKGSNTNSENLTLISVKCGCKLLIKHYHFNYSSLIIDLLVTCLRTYDTTFQEVQECFRQLLENDRNMDISLDIVRSICKWIKKKHFKVNCHVIDLFLMLQIDETNANKNISSNDASDRKRDIKEMTKRQRKRYKETAKLRKVLEEETITEKNSQILRKNTMIMEQVFNCYFRILKQRQRASTLSSVLHGLSKFAHLINVDFYDSLLESLIEIIDENKDKTNQMCKEVLYCLMTAGCVQSHQNRDVTGIDVDATRFFQQLYEILPNISNGGISSCDYDPLISAISQLLVRQCKELNKNRLRAFMKRFSTLALNCDDEALTSTILILLQQIFQSLPTFPEAFFYTDKGGLFLDNVDHPDFCNSQCASMFEIPLLKKSYSNTICKTADALCSSDAKSATKINVNDYFRCLKNQELNVNGGNTRHNHIKRKHLKHSLIHNDFLRRSEREFSSRMDLKLQNVNTTEKRHRQGT
ncbi:hypothetical protein GJ496_007380 [Pomphorhynchus laevis]|nr:hypothetical protein GJ496_007380 [Pomphorhynchus laevis]